MYSSPTAIYTGDPGLKRFNSYEISYNRIRKRWHFNIGDCQGKFECILYFDLHLSVKLDSFSCSFTSISFLTKHFLNMTWIFKKYDHSVTTLNVAYCSWSSKTLNRLVSIQYIIQIYILFDIGCWLGYNRDQLSCRQDCGTSWLGQTRNNWRF